MVKLQKILLIPWKMRIISSILLPPFILWMPMGIISGSVGINLKIIKESENKNVRLLQEDSNPSLNTEPMSMDMSSPTQNSVEKLHIKTHSTINIFCPKGSRVCERNTFVFYPEINHSSYHLQIELDTGHLAAQFESFHFTAVTANSKYTMFLLLLRYSLFILSVIMGSRYFKVYWALNKFVRTFEHKAIFWMSIFLILFNDPFYAATILKANIFFSVLSTLFVCVFLTSMIVFWIVMLQRMHKEPALAETKLFNTKSTKFLGKK
jgi:hypothetical protein